MTEENKSKLYQKILMLSIVAFGFLWGLTLLFDGDTYFHLKLGEWITKNGIIREDVFSMHSDLKYVAYCYGFEVIAYMFYNWLGWTGVSIFRFLLYGTFALIFFLIIKKISKSNITAALLSSIGIAFMGGYFVVRPQVSSYIILIIQLYIMHTWTKNRSSKAIWFLPLTFLALAHLHAGVFLYHLFASAVFGIDLLLVRDEESNKIRVNNIFKDKNLYKYVTVGLLSIATLLTNPYFPDILTYSIKTVTDPQMMKINEWQSPELNNFKAVFLIVLLIITLMRSNFKKVPIGHTILLALNCYFVCTAYRFLPYLAITCIIALAYAKNYDDTIDRFFQKEKFYRVLIPMMLSIGVAVSGVTFFYDNPGFYRFEREENMAPQGVVDYIKENELEGRFYNHYNIGAFLLYNDIPVFIDSRCDLYSEHYNDTSVLQDFFDTLEGKMDFFELNEKYDFDYVIAMKGETMYKYHLKDYREEPYVIYEDDNFALFDVRAIVGSVEGE